jgi:small-conductance mechanosensitive channel
VIPAQVSGLLDSTPEQFVASVLVGLGFLLGAAAVYRVGGPLKRRVPNDVAEALQALGVMTLGILGGAALVDIWNQVAAVGQAWAQISPGAEVGVRALIALLALGVTYTVTRITKRFVRVGERRDAISTHQREILHHIVQIALFIPASLFILTLFGAGVGNVLLSASVLGVVVGLAARQTLGAVLAGFVLLFSRPFELGDWVQLHDHEGVVTDVSIVNTEIRTFDDEVVLIPNDEITSRAILNRSKNDRLRVQVDVGVDYETDVERAMTVAADAMAGLDELKEAPAPDVVVESFGDSAVVLTLRFYIDDPSIRRKWDAQNAVMEAVKTAFEREGIAIPFPQRVLSGREQAGGLQVTGDRVAASGDPEAAVEPATDGGEGGDR